MRSAAPRTERAARSGETAATATEGREWHTRAGTIEVAIPKLLWVLLPGVAIDAPPSCRPGDGQRGGDLLPARGEHAARGQASRATRHHPAAEVRGQRDGKGSGRPGPGSRTSSGWRWPPPRTAPAG